jgi:hypothetical protein
VVVLVIERDRSPVDEDEATVDSGSRQGSIRNKPAHCVDLVDPNVERIADRVRARSDNIFACFS